MQRAIFRIMSCGLLFLLLTKSLSSQQTVRELSPGVYYYFGDELKQKSANCTWIIFKNFVLVIDANYPWGAEEILSEIRKTTDKQIRFVFNTHYHHDHTFGNAVFADAGATIVSTEACAKEMRTKGNTEWKQRSDYSGREMKSAIRQFPLLTFSDTLTFADEEHEVRLIRMGPAHTAGDGVAYLPREKILITGDLFVNGNPWGNNVEDADVNFQRWFDVLDTLASWSVNIVVPGHGEPATVQHLKNQRAYLYDLYRQVSNGIRNGRTKQQVVDEIDLSKHPVYGENKTSTRRSAGAIYDRLKETKN